MFRFPPFLMLEGEPASGGTATVEPPAAPAPGQEAPPAAPPAAPATPPAPLPGPPAGSQPPAPAAPGAPAAPAAPPATLTAEQIAELPQWAQDEIRSTRREAQNLRQTRADAETQAAADARAAVAQEIGRALGLVPNEEPPDPSVLATQVADSQREAREARVELAVFRSAPSTAAATLLLDSRSFMTKVAGLDPKAATFDAQVASAIADEVALNPTRFSAPAAPAAPASTGGAPITGAPPSGTPESIEELRTQYRTSQGLGA